MKGNQCKMLLNNTNHHKKSYKENLRHLATSQAYTTVLDQCCNERRHPLYKKTCNI